MARNYDRRPGRLFCRSDDRTREENLSLMEQFKEEVKNLLTNDEVTERAVRCPRCNRVIMTAYSNCSMGHVTVECRCGLVVLLNLGVFKTKGVDKNTSEYIDF